MEPERTGGPAPSGTRGLPGAPAVVGEGVADGQQALGFIPGESPHPRAWSDEAVGEVGVLLRDLHRATASVVPPAGAVWRPWFGRDLPGSLPTIGHCDTGPWNIIARDGAPVAFAGWENCGPVDARWELVQTTWLNAQLHDDDVAERNRLPDVATRARQVRMILDGYGLPASEREGFVDALVQLAVCSAAQDAIDGGVTPDSILPIQGPGRSGGEPLLAHLAWGLHGEHAQPRGCSATGAFSSERSRSDRQKAGLSGPGQTLAQSSRPGRPRRPRAVRRARAVMASMPHGRHRRDPRAG